MATWDVIRDFFDGQMAAAIGSDYADNPNRPTLVEGIATALGWTIAEYQGDQSALESRVEDLESIDAGTRLDAAEATIITHTGDIANLQAQNAGARLDALEIRMSAEENDRGRHPRAWAYCSVTSAGVITLLNGYGVSSVAVTGFGARIILSSPLSSTNVCVIPVLMTSTAPSEVLRGHIISTSEVRALLVNASTGTTVNWASGASTRFFSIVLYE